MLRPMKHCKVIPSRCLIALIACLALTACDEAPPPEPEPETATVAGALLVEVSPPARASHSAVWDTEGDQMIVFGGRGQTYLNDLWTGALIGGTWVWTRVWPTGPAPSPRKGHSAIWDEVHREMLVFGGFGEDGPLNDLWSLTWSGSAWAWTQIVPEGDGPAPRYSQACVWDAQAQEMLVYGGRGDEYTSGQYFADLWSLRREGDGYAWSLVTPVGPALLGGADFAAAWDEVGQRMVLAEGRWKNIFGLGTWAFARDGEAWVRVPIGATPGYKYTGSTGAWDSAGRRMFAFGGRSEVSDHDLVITGFASSARVLQFDGSGLSWSALSPSNPPQFGREHASAVWDPKGQRLFTYGGSGWEGHSDLWMYTPEGATPGWLQLWPSTAPPTRRSSAVVWDPIGKRLLMVGGFAAYQYQHDTFLGDLWSYSEQDGGWSWSLENPNVLNPLYGHVATWDALGQQILVFGPMSENITAMYKLYHNGTKWTAGSLPSTGKPQGKYMSSVWDPVGRRMIVYGGTQATTGNDLWEGSDVTGKWAWKKIVPAAGFGLATREWHTAVWDGEGQRMIVYGGTLSHESYSALSDIYALTWDGSNWKWSSLPIEGPTPPPRTRPVAAWDEVGRQMVIYGGWGNKTVLGDVWSLRRDGVAWVWTEVKAEGPSPGPRESHAATWDADGRRMLVFGGYDGFAYRNDVWSLSAKGNSWAWSPLGDGCEGDPIVPDPAAPVAGATAWACGAVALRWSDAGPRKGYRYVVELDGAEVARFEAESGAPLEVTAAAAPGAHTWSVRTEGCTGRVASTGTLPFTVAWASLPAVPGLTPQRSEKCTVETAARTFAWTTSPEARYDLVLNGQFVATDLTAGSYAMPAGTFYPASNTWRIIAKNCKGKTQSATDAFSVTSSIIPLAPVLTAPADGVTVSCIPTLTWSYPGQAARVRFDVLASDGSVLANGLSGTSWTPPEASWLSDGAHALAVRASNCLGDSAVSDFGSFDVDGTPGTPALQTPAPEQLTGPTPALRWSAGGVRAPALTWNVTMDAKPLPLAQGLTAPRWQIPTAAPLPEGLHTWQVVAHACKTSAATSAATTFRVDATPPRAFGLRAPHDGTSLSSIAGPPRLFWLPTQDDTAGLAHYRVLIDGSVAALAPPTATNWQVTPIPTPGSHTWTIVAVDTVGNERPADAVWTFQAP